MIEIYRLGVPSMAEEPHGCLFLTAGHRQASSDGLFCNLWKGNSMFWKLLFYKKEDLQFGPIPWAHWLPSLISFRGDTGLLFGCPMLASQKGCTGMRRDMFPTEWQARAVFIGYVFMLHLVTFAGSKFICFPLGMLPWTVLKGPLLVLP